MKKKHLVLFEPDAGGHHGLFVQHLVNYWGKHRIDGTLELVVTEVFMQTHAHIPTLLTNYSASDIRISYIAPLSPISGSLRDLIRHDFRQGAVLKKTLEDLRPSHALLMYFDHLQLSLGTILRSAPQTHIAGIYFRPSFHYPILKSESVSPLNALTQIRKKAQLNLALRNPRLQTLFSLDPYIVSTLNKMSRHLHAVVLPDGVEQAQETVDQPVPEWNIEPNRFTALCFGSLASRKGVFVLLDALSHLSEDAQKHLALVFVGVVSDSERTAFYERLQQARAQTAVQIVLDDRFVEDREVSPMLRQSNVILVAYQRHVGSSNVLIRAAEAGIPVLGSNYGLLGAQIHDHRLGTAVDSTDPKALANALEQHMHPNQAIRFDADQAKRFADANNATEYAETIFSSLGYI